MAEIATLGIRVDAQGAVTNVNQVAGSLFGLGATAQGTQSKVRQFATQGAVSLGQLASSGARDIGSLLRSAANLGFALGPITGAIGLAIAGIGVHWWETRKEAKAAQEAMQRDMEAFEKNMTGAALRMRIKRLENQRDDLNDEIRFMPLNVGSVMTDTRRMNKMIAAAEELNRRIGALRDREGKEIRDAAAQAVKDEKKAWDERLKNAEQTTKLMNDLFGDASIVGGLKELFGGPEPVKAPSIFDDLKLAAKGANTELEGIVRNLQKMLDAMDEQTRKAKQREAMILGSVMGVGANALSNMGGVFGVIGGGISGGFANAAGGPAAIAFGVVDGIMNGLAGIGDKAAAQREAMERLQQQYDSFTDSIKEQLGFMSPLEARMRAVQREFADMREPFEAIAEAARVSGLNAGDAADKLNELNSLERAYLDLLREQSQQRATDIGQESAVLRLRIQGNTELADSMQRTIDKQNELREAHEAGASQAEITAIKERQRLEDILKAVEQTQEKIAAFAATISNLQAFRNALLLSADAGLSPTQGLAEARRQYEEILAKALGGDQAAAGQLTGAAQTLLEFSRAVNASGANFQSDLQKVLADNAAVIAKFEDLKTIEELMLEELRKIAADTGALSGRESRPDRPTDRGFLTAEESEALTSSVVLMQEGFLTLRNRMDTLTARVEEQTQVNRGGFAELTSNTVNAKS